MCVCWDWTDDQPIILWQTVMYQQYNNIVFFSCYTIKLLRCSRCTAIGSIFDSYVSGTVACQLVNCGLTFWVQFHVWLRGRRQGVWRRAQRLAPWRRASSTSSAQMGDDLWRRDGAPADPPGPKCNSFCRDLLPPSQNNYNNFDLLFRNILTKDN